MSCAVNIIVVLSTLNAWGVRLREREREIERGGREREREREGREKS